MPAMASPRRLTRPRPDVHGSPAWLSRGAWQRAGRACGRPFCRHRTEIAGHLSGPQPAWAGCWRSRQPPMCRRGGPAYGARRARGGVRVPFGSPPPVTIPARPDSVLLAYKRLSARKPAFSSKAVAELADLLGLAWDDQLTVADDYGQDALQLADRRHLPRRTSPRPPMSRGRMPNRLPRCWPIRWWLSLVMRPLEIVSAIGQAKRLLLT